jgi:hypothetical protein
VAQVDKWNAEVDQRERLGGVAKEVAKCTALLAPVLAVARAAVRSPCLYAALPSGARARSGGPCRSPCTGPSGARADSGPWRPVLAGDGPCIGPSGARACSSCVQHSLPLLFWRACWQQPVPQSLRQLFGRPCSQ